jgi:hypothetical protein
VAGEPSDHLGRNSGETGYVWKKIGMKKLEIPEICADSVAKHSLNMALSDRHN